MSDSHSVRRLDTKSFSGAIVSMKKATNELNHAKDQIVKTTELLRNNWDGHGKDKFFESYDFLIKQIKDETDNMKTVYESLEEILSAYETWDGKNQSVIQQSQGITKE